MAKKLRWNCWQVPQGVLILFQVRLNGSYQTYIGRNDGTEMFDDSGCFLGLYDTDVVRWMLYTDIDDMIDD